MSAVGIVAIVLVLVIGAGAYFAYQSGYLQDFLGDYRIGVPDLDIPSIEDLAPQTGELAEEPVDEEFEDSVTFLVGGEEVVYPTLFPNPRWNHAPIKFYMDVESGEDLFGFDEDDIGYVRTATKIWEEKTEGVIAFQEVTDPSEAELVFSWFASLTEITGGRVVGEGGPTRAIDTGSKFTLIEGGEVFLIPTENKCVGVNRPVHEVGHVLGLGHAPSGFGDIMFSKEISCKQNITEITIGVINELYGEAAAPDLVITDVKTVKKGNLLDLNFTVKNIGLTDYLQTEIGFVGDGNEIEGLSVPRFSVIPRILPGSGVTSSITNTKISASLSELVLTIDKNNEIEEMNEDNNEARVTFSAS